MAFLRYNTRQSVIYSSVGLIILLVVVLGISSMGFSQGAVYQDGKLILEEIQEVYRKQGEEEWIFGEKGNPMSIKFLFYEAENPLTSNDFRLQRSTAYQTSWYIAVDNWRR